MKEGLSRPSGWNPVPVWSRDEKYDDWRRRVQLWRDAFPLDASNKMLVAQLIGNSFQKRDDHLTKVCYEWYESYDFKLHDAEVKIVTFEEPADDDKNCPGVRAESVLEEPSKDSKQIDPRAVKASVPDDDDIEGTPLDKVVKSVRTITTKSADDIPLKDFLSMVKEKTHGDLEFQMLEDIMKFQKVVRVEKESMAAYMQRFRLQQRRVEAHGSSTRIYYV